MIRDVNLGELARKVDLLDSMKVVEDHFFANEANYIQEKSACFDPVTVQPGQTIEVSANINTSRVSANTGTENLIVLKRANQ